MAAVLHNAAGRPEADAAALPADCDPSAWYAGAVAWALQEGLFHGYGDGSAFGCVLSTRFEQNEHRNLSSLRTRRAQAF